ncbi:MAG: hypothetical protein ABSG95_10800 [Solirubrobacteraceae bacterium]
MSVMSSWSSTDVARKRRALSFILGHASIAMTFDTYAHLMPGGLDEEAAAANAYVARLGDRRLGVASARRATPLPLGAMPQA